MNRKETRKVAVLIDGGYYRKRATILWGRKAASERADELFRYCLLHLEKPDEPRDLYRIFYYDCPGLTREITHPLTGESILYANMPGTKWTNDLFEALSLKRKVAIRRGELAENQAHFVLKDDPMRRLIAKEITVDDLVKDDFKLEVKQKGVDMRIGLDVASLASGRYVDQIILIAGDSDFIPVAKMARKHGIDFILDPMGQNIKPKLSEHIDGLETYTDYMYPKSKE